MRHKQKAPAPTSLRLPEGLRSRIHKQATLEDRTATSLMILLLTDGLAVREVSYVKESSRFKNRLIKLRAKQVRERGEKGQCDASVLD